MREVPRKTTSQLLKMRNQLQVQKAREALHYLFTATSAGIQRIWMHFLSQNWNSLTTAFRASKGSFLFAIRSSFFSSRLMGWIVHSISDYTRRVSSIMRSEYICQISSTSFCFLRTNILRRDFRISSFLIVPQCVQLERFLSQIQNHAVKRVYFSFRVG